MIKIEIFFKGYFTSCIFRLLLISHAASSKVRHKALVLTQLDIHVNDATENSVMCKMTLRSYHNEHKCSFLQEQINIHSIEMYLQFGLT